VMPGLRSRRAQLQVLPDLALVKRQLAIDTVLTIEDAIENVIKVALTQMRSSRGSDGRTTSPDPAAALAKALALRPGSEMIVAKTRRQAAAEAMQLISSDGWRSHHEKPLLLDLARVICSLEVQELHQVSGEADIGLSPAMAGIHQIYPDFVDIEVDWHDFLTESPTLDLAIMYGATWRNTYRKQLHALVRRADGRLRIVLPDITEDSPLVPLYANRLSISNGEFRVRVETAISDFASIDPRRHVEIYLTRLAFHHAIYLFTGRAVVGLYALCAERIPAPAFLAGDGVLLDFLRSDFDKLLPKCRRVQ
jgi:hypothetical protein